jgi:hypothetical protein
MSHKYSAQLVSAIDPRITNRHIVIAGGVGTLTSQSGQGLTLLILGGGIVFDVTLLWQQPTVGSNVTLCVCVHLLFKNYILSYTYIHINIHTCKQ